MPNPSYKKGYRFELRVKKYLEDKGYIVIRQGKSAFPDLIAINIKHNLPFIMFVECKVNGYLPKNDREKFKKLYKTILTSIHKNSDNINKEFAKKLLYTKFNFRVAYRDGKKIAFYEVRPDEGDG